MQAQNDGDNDDNCPENGDGNENELENGNDLGDDIQSSVPRPVSIFSILSTNEQELELKTREKEATRGVSVAANTLLVLNKAEWKVIEGQENNEMAEEKEVKKQEVEMEMKMKMGRSMTMMSVSPPLSFFPLSQISPSSHIPQADFGKQEQKKSSAKARKSRTTRIQHSNYLRPSPFVPRLSAKYSYSHRTDRACETIYTNHALPRHPYRLCKRYASNTYSSNTDNVLAPSDSLLARHWIYPLSII